LTAAQILARTHGNAGWLAFYAVFALAVAVHAPIGLRAVCREWLGWRGASLDVLLVALSFAVALLGWRAAWAVYA
jgi:fumarate reductase subunit C